MEWKVYEESFNSKSKGVISWLEEEFAKLRTGRVLPSALDHIKVDAYGDLQQLKTLQMFLLPNQEF